MSHSRVINKLEPGRSYVMRQKWPRMVWEVIDVTAMPEPELNDFKAKTLNYATTEAGGKYYILILADIIDRDIEPSTPDFAKTINDLFLQASDWWHGFVIQNLN